MALFNIFKKRKKREPKKEEEGERKEEGVKIKKEEEVKKIKGLEEKIDKEKEKITVRTPTSGRRQKLRKKETRVAPFVLKSPRITEKATFLQNRNQYIFKVFSNAVKAEIKKAIEEVYGVDVLTVRTIKIPRKRKRLGRTMGWRKGYKKAIVTVKKGQSIEVLPR